MRSGKPTKAIFDIAERTGYFANGGSEWIPTKGRPADLYIFAWHPGFDPESAVDHTDSDQWEFYLLPEKCLPPGQKSIALTSLKKLDPVAASYLDIAENVEALVPQMQPQKWTLTSPAD
jgi:hypothetical protein